MKKSISILALLLAVPRFADAVIVDPDGVNVRHSGTSTAFLTFRDLRPDQSPREGTWCGELAPDGSCSPSSIFGRLPARLDRSRLSGTNAFTDVMSIPASVSRRAFQDARRGASSEFFYVRRFASDAGLPDEFVAVTCRMASGGARSPLALTNVELEFDDDATIQRVRRGSAPTPFRATIRYNGTGRLKGRWEVVIPGDPAPSERDLLTEATLPVEERGLQRRYTLVDRFEKFLSPAGIAVIEGPDPEKLPSGVDGYHLILFRVETSDDREGDSNTGSFVVHSGGVAGFPMPVLRYFVGQGALPSAPAAPAMRVVSLVAPPPNATAPAGQPVRFQWTRVEGAKSYELVAEAEGESVLTAIVNAPRTGYAAPPWLGKQQAGARLEWKVRALGTGGAVIAESKPRSLALR